MTPPCASDFKLTGREWETNSPPKTRAQLQEMTSLCKTQCKVRKECRKLADIGLRDLNGRWHGPVEGVWDGWLYRNGQKIDPFGTDSGDMRSVYYLVWHDKHRGTWRAEAVVDGVRHYIAHGRDEDEVGRAAWEWYEQFTVHRESRRDSSGPDGGGQRGSEENGSTAGESIGGLAITSTSRSTVQGES